MVVPPMELGRPRVPHTPGCRATRRKRRAPEPEHSAGRMKVARIQVATVSIAACRWRTICRIRILTLRPRCYRGRVKAPDLRATRCYSQEVMPKVQSRRGGWTGEFDVAVRFDDDYLPATWDNFQVRTVDVELLEILL